MFNWSAITPRNWKECQLLSATEKIEYFEMLFAISLFQCVMGTVGTGDIKHSMPHPLPMQAPTSSLNSHTTMTARCRQLSYIESVLTMCYLRIHVY